VGCGTTHPTHHFRCLVAVITMDRFRSSHACLQHGFWLIAAHSAALVAAAGRIRRAQRITMPELHWVGFVLVVVLSPGAARATARSCLPHATASALLCLHNITPFPATLRSGPRSRVGSVLFFLWLVVTCCAW
jgi:hypothetical protein